MDRKIKIVLLLNEYNMANERKEVKSVKQEHPADKLFQTPKTPEADYQKALDEFKKRNVDYKNWASDSYLKLKYRELTENERTIVRRAYNYVIKRYDTKIPFESFLRMMIIV